MNARYQWGAWLLALSAVAACTDDAFTSDTGTDDEGPVGTDSAVAEPSDTDTGGASSDTAPDDSDPGQDTAEAAGVEEMPADEQAAYHRLMADYEASLDMTADALLAKYEVPFAEEIGFDPLLAENLGLIQASSLALSGAALDRLGENGFVIIDDPVAPTFFNAYESIYKADLPVYISADSILDAVHRSYDAILAEVESAVLVGDLEAMLDRLRHNLEGFDGGGDADILADLDLYLAVAHSLLTGAVAPPVRGADPAAISKLYNMAVAAEGMAEAVLFGVERLFDFSQFTPRGHYDDWRLRDYFKAMMWLGRIDFRMVETDPLGKRTLNRRQVEGVVLLDALMGDAERTAWGRINDTIEAFVGKSDNMTVPEVAALKADLSVATLADLAAVEDATLEATILGNGYGTQQICSHLMVNGMESGTLPLNASFLLFGQRYVVDSHVFSNVVYDRVAEGTEKRMMPDPLDVAFAALENDQAAALLEDELRRYDYATELEMSRALVAAHGEDFWSLNLYNLWLDALRTLAPVRDEVSGPAAAGLSAVFATEAWGRRLLNTQLGSWAELRHDTLLYAKQSYTAIPSCEYPDAYVDPYPRFFEAIERFADKGLGIADIAAASGEAWLESGVRTYFTELGAASAMLAEMAHQQRVGQPFTAEQLAFVNDAVYIGEEDVVCAIVPEPVGWYTRLFYNTESLSPFERDPVIADVHTQPADEGGVVVGRVLHVAVGEPRMMVVAVDTCTGPRAYVGPVFSYFEKVTEGFERQTDTEWAAELEATKPVDVPWMGAVIAP